MASLLTLWPLTAQANNLPIETITPVPPNVIAPFLVVHTPQFPDRSKQYQQALSYDAALSSCEAQGGTFNANGCYVPPPPPPPVVAPIQTSSVVIDYTNLYTPGQCVWAIKNWKPEVPNGLGDARNWGYALGYDTNPTIGAVAWTTAGYYGHVAEVVAISNGQVEVKEMNGYLGPFNIDYRWASINEFAYIHI